MTLLEFNRDHRQEIEALQEDKALFVLTFINEIGNTNRTALSAHLGWDAEEIDGLLNLLMDAELVRNAPISRDASSALCWRSRRSVLASRQLRVASRFTGSRNKRLKSAEPETGRFQLLL